MKPLLIATACILLGNGAGLLILDLVIGTPLQAFVISALALGALLLRLPQNEWAPPLTLSLASSLTVINLRMIFSLLYLVLTNRDALSRASPLLGNLKVPTSLFSESMLTLLLITYAMSVGFSLIHDSVIRALSPLWEGVEALPTTIERAAGRYSQSELSVLTLAGIAAGSLFAILDAFFPLNQLGFHSYHAGFIMLMLASSTLATVTTLGVHLLLITLAFRTASSASTVKVLHSVCLGVQAGVLISTLIAAVLLHTRGAARNFPRVIANVATLAMGVLVTILGLAFLIPPTYVIFVTLFILFIIVLSDLITIRLEGGFYLLTSVPDSFAPNIVGVATLLLLDFAGMREFTPVLAIFMSSSLHLVLAAMNMWNHKLSKGYIRSVILAIICILAPTGLMLARAVMKPEYEDPLIYIQKEWMIGLAYRQSPELNFIVNNLDINVFIIIACLSSILAFFLNYYRKADHKLNWATLFFDSTGLLVAYSSMWGNGGYFYLNSTDTLAEVLLCLIFLIAVIRYVGIVKFTLRYSQIMSNALSFYGISLVLLKLARY